MSGESRAVSPVIEAKIERAAEAAHRAFCESAKEFMPAFPPLWIQLPDVVKKAFRAAAVAARDSGLGAQD
jgi:hypothetical protein